MEIIEKMNVELKFNLENLLKTVFNPKGGERVCILIDLDSPEKEMKNFSFLSNEKYSIQFRAHKYFYREFEESVLKSLKMQGGEMFAYQTTFGSNLDLPDEAWDAEGKQYSLEKDVYPNFDIILCISTYSATAPLTAFAKQYGFRGATLHGLNDIILNSGLAVDYNEVSKEAEKLRSALSKADSVEMDFEIFGKKANLKIELGGQDAQKSHGLCLGGPDIANLPAGEVYFVPVTANGEFPYKYEDGSIAMLKVVDRFVKEATLLRGNQEVVDAHNKKLAFDPSVGELGELGLGTQELPVSGRDIQDEKIFGTFHIATGRSDHLGGDITPDKFNDKRNATHDDILYSKEKMPELNYSEIRWYKGEQIEVLIKNFEPQEFYTNLRK